jgi:signal transduction histidine kinase
VPSALIFAVPAGVSLVLAGLTTAAYWQVRRPYLRVWAVVWVIVVLYYVALSQRVLEDTRTDSFAMLGVSAALFGWLRAVGFWVGARALVGHVVSTRTLGLLALLTVLWVVLVDVTLAGQPFVPGLTRASYAVWYLAAALVLLLYRPNTPVGLLTGCFLLLLATQGFLVSWLVLDFWGSLVSAWVASALSLAVGLSVLGRLLEEEREAATAREHELATANARLSELDRLKSEFVSMVSHELRTPLGLIKGYTGTLLAPDTGLDANTREEFLQVIDEETDRLTELVTNLLDMSRIEAGSLHVDLQPTRLEGLVRASADRLQTREPGRTLHLDLPERLPLVLADTRRIIQVLDNLLTNAVRYSPEDSPIALAARTEDGVVEVTVRDQGLGIPADKREQVFEKFFRVDPSDTRRFAGTGLGLAICRGIVQTHGGTIGVESEEGQGSTFTVRLPIYREGA